MGIGNALSNHRRVIRQPRHAARHPGRPADEFLLLDDQRFDARVERRQRGNHSAAAAPRDERSTDLSQFTMPGPVVEAQIGNRHVDGRLRLLNRGRSRSYGDPARNRRRPARRWRSTPRSDPTTSCPRTPSACRPSAASANSRVWAGSSAGSGRPAPAARVEWVSPATVVQDPRSDQTSNNVCSGPSRTIHYDDALLYCGRMK